MKAIGSTKYCPICKQLLPLSAFGKHKKRNDSLAVYCRVCKNAKSQERRQKPEVKVRRRAYAQERRRKIRSDPETLERYRKAQRDYVRKRRAEDPEFRARDVESSRQYYHEHKDDPGMKQRCADAQRKHRENPEVRARHNAKQNEYRKNRRANDLEFRQRWCDYERRRKAKKRANGGSFRIEDWRIMCDLVEGRCLACGEELSLTLDHIVPINAGGTSDLVNIQPLCAPCNSSKGTKTMDNRPQWLIDGLLICMKENKMARAKVEKKSDLPFAGHVVPVLPNTPEAEALLRPAYQMTVAEAQELIKAREENPTHVPWDVYQKAKAFMANYSSKPGVTSTRPGWKRGPRPM